MRLSLPAAVCATLLCTSLHTGLMAQEKNQAAKTITCPGRQLPYPRIEPNYNGKIKRDLSPFEQELAKFATRKADVAALVEGQTIPGLQALMNAGKLHSTDLVLYYLDRIRQVDIGQLNSVLEVNPDVLDIARKMDKERKRKAGNKAMYGIPVLLKDNIATADKLHTAAGTAAMLAWKPSRDAFLVKQLREAGAIILGKANMSEWANYMDQCMPSGFSVNGGQTRNPYGPFDTWGSSSGSAVAVAADLVTVSVGSETQGSIIMPARINSVVGLKTSMGLVSRSNIIPLLEYQDVPGPMGKTVTDVAIMLSAMTGVDPLDTATTRAGKLAGVDFSAYLKPGAANGLRIGVPVTEEVDITKALERMGNASDEAKQNTRNFLEKRRATALAAAKVFTDAGLKVVFIPDSLMPRRQNDIGQALTYGFKQDLNHFLAGLGKEAPFKSMEEIIAFNKQDMANRAPYGHGLVEGAQNNKISEASFNEIKTRNIAIARRAIDSVLNAFQVDLLVSDVNQVYAPAGYPAISIPSGYDEKGTPEALILVGTYLSEPQLIAAGFVYEQATKARKVPPLAETLATIKALK
ncbi:hypothetical protein KJS94_15230 [Flavihumibacter rivuli]|uniref:amidase family protein n=1 Tax=Flavihumibacter rivuli TaxID=2838156 RepID=UPI001BDEBD67|nr:amidase family protein [Flavihumibacter rivuli]ULQ56000.1 hypothetical protein KJS94_15230 [Flavihumibacter rivuli]